MVFLLQQPKQLDLQKQAGQFFVVVVVVVVVVFPVCSF